MDLTLWIEIRRHAHCLDGAVSIVVLVRDITARKTAESRIRHLNRVYAILSGINTLIVRVGIARRIVSGGLPHCRRARAASLRVG